MNVRRFRTCVKMVDALTRWGRIGASAIKGTNQIPVGISVLVRSYGTTLVTKTS